MMCRLASTAGCSKDFCLTFDSCQSITRSVVACIHRLDLLYSWIVDTSGACRPRPGPGSDGGARDSGEWVAYAPKQSNVTGTGASAEGAVNDLQCVLKRFKQWAPLNVDTAMLTLNGKLPASCHAAQHPRARKGLLVGEGLAEGI
jgi:hypothetical protein